MLHNMNLKNILLVIIVSILIGVGIFYGMKLLSPSQSSNISPLIKLNPFRKTETAPTASADPRVVYPSPTPKPSLEPINESSNLEEEINKLTPKNYSEDFTELKEEINH